MNLDRLKESEASDKLFPKELLALVCFGVLIAGNQSLAKEPSPKIRELTFKLGSNTIIRKDGFESGGVREYHLTGQTGQVVVIRISSRPFGSVVPVEGAIQSPDGKTLPLSYDGIERWSVTLSGTGQYVLRVSSKGPSRGKLAYILTVTMKPGEPTAAPVSDSLHRFTNLVKNHAKPFGGIEA